MATFDTQAQNVQAVLHAARNLKASLNRGPVAINNAVNWLEQAGREHAPIVERRFAEEEVTGAKPVLDEVTLAGVAADLQVANTLIAASYAVGETGEPNPNVLDEALLRLDNARAAFATAPQTLGFVEEKVHSLDLPQAIETFRMRAEDALATLVTEARAATGSIVTSLAKIDGQKVLEAIGTLSEQSTTLPKLGRLFHMGVVKLQSVVDFLRRLLNNEALKAVTEKVKEIWTKASKGEYTDEFLKWLFETQKTQDKVAEILKSPNLKRESVDDASDRASEVAGGYKEKMSWTTGIATAVGYTGTLLLLTSIAAATAALFTASAYVLLLAAVLLIGMNCADSLRHVADGLMSTI